MLQKELLLLKSEYTHTVRSIKVVQKQGAKHTKAHAKTNTQATAKGSAGKGGVIQNIPWKKNKSQGRYGHNDAKVKQDSGEHHCDHCTKWSPQSTNLNGNTYTQLSPHKHREIWYGANEQYMYIETPSA